MPGTGPARYLFQDDGLSREKQRLRKGVHVGVPSWQPAFAGSLTLLPDVFVPCASDGLAPDNTFFHLVYNRLIQASEHARMRQASQQVPIHLHFTRLMPTMSLLQVELGALGLTTSYEKVAIKVMWDVPCVFVCAGPPQTVMLPVPASAGGSGRRGLGGCSKQVLALAVLYGSYMCVFRGEVAEDQRLLGPLFEVGSSFLFLWGCWHRLGWLRWGVSICLWTKAYMLRAPLIMSVIPQPARRLILVWLSLPSRRCPVP